MVAKFQFIVLLLLYLYWNVDIIIATSRILRIYFAFYGPLVYSHRGTDISSPCKPASTSCGLHSFAVFCMQNPENKTLRYWDYKHEFKSSHRKSEVSVF